MVPTSNSAQARWTPGSPRLAAHLALILLAALLSSPAPAQDQPPTPQFSIHGLVKDAASGEPLPRARVLANGESGIGVLTDGDGRFELDGLSPGPNVFQVSKPGYDDGVGDSGGLPLREVRGMTHTVYVSADTPGLTFTLRRSNTIHGHVDLSTGDPSQGISIMLIAQQIVNGRAIWRLVRGANVRADGNYRFAHLPDGDYALHTEPASDTGDAALSDASSNRISATGFPQTYYPDSPTFSGSARLHVAGGEDAQADLSLVLRTFHLVRAQVSLPPGFRGEASGGSVQVEVATADGIHAPYPTAFDPKTGTFRAMLPDGAYTILVTALDPKSLATRGRQHPVTNSASFTVAGHPVTNLRIAVGAQIPNPLQVSITRTSTRDTPNSGQVYVYLTQTGPLTDGMQAQYAQGPGPGTLDTIAPTPGRYWVHTAVADPALCESSFAAGGASLAREPLVVAAGGATAPLTLALRDDCASLRVTLPPAASQMAAGQEPAYTVYVVPDFDFTTDPQTITVRPSSGGSFQFQRLTPGAYHVYTFAAPVDLEYHNPRLLASLHGQSVTLDPGATADLVLEAPAP